MSDYNTGNPVPSIDPRDLDDNATVFDLLLNSSAASVPDRLGVPRKTYHQMEADAAALVSPNVSALAALTLSANKGLYATGAGALATYDLSSLGRTLGGIANGAAGRAAIGAAASGANTDITSITGSAASLTTSRSISISGDATWTVNFNGTANATGVITLANSGVSAGTYGAVTVNAKGLVTAAQAATPIANGGTGQTSQGAALTALLGASTVPVANGGTGQTSIAAAAAAIAVPKLAWTAYTPTISATSGTFTTTSSTGKYVVISGICYFQATLTFTTKGTGAFPTFSLPQPALSGSAGVPLPCREASINAKVGAASIGSGLTSASPADSAGGDLVTGNGAIIIIQGFYPVA